jgi:hypothetical protein
MFSRALLGSAGIKKARPKDEAGKAGTSFLVYGYGVARPWAIFRTCLGNASLAAKGIHLKAG